MDRNIVQVTPFMHVPDLEAALAFMTGTLGFAVDFQMANYAYVSRDGAGLRMLEAVPATRSGPAPAASLIISIAAMSTRSTHS